MYLHELPPNTRDDRRAARRFSGASLRSRCHSQGDGQQEAALDDPGLDTSSSVGNAIDPRGRCSSLLLAGLALGSQRRRLSALARAYSDKCRDLQALLDRQVQRVLRSAG